MPLCPQRLETKPAKAAKKAAFPKCLTEQARAVRSALRSHGKPATAAELARTFQGARADKVRDLLETLASLRQAGGGRQPICGVIDS